MYNILDFGAGYGRQANIWMQKRKNIIYVGMDAVPLSYCLQHFYYSQLSSYLSIPFYEYIYMDNDFEIVKPGIYHLPTWRYDLLPKNFFDMVICVQVLQEIDSKLVKHMIDIFYSILKPGGALYIRDHDEVWKPAHNINLNEYLSKNGFYLEFKPYIVDKEDIHGIPRIWRKEDIKVIRSKKVNMSTRLKKRMYMLDSRFGGKLSTIWRYIK